MRSALLATLLLVAGGTTGCAGFELNESICAEGREPTWALNDPRGGTCLRDGVPPPPGYARYPRGRVPVWVNPPADYPERTPQGHDRYYINPNSPRYPWWDEVLAEHPELDCRDAAEPFAEIPLKPRSPGAPAVTVLLNTVGNRCLRFAWDGDPGAVLRSELTVHEKPYAPAWRQVGDDAATAQEPLRVASAQCLTVFAAITIKDSGGTATTYRVDRARVPRGCSPR